MDRTIRVRSSRLDRTAAELEALGREKESELEAAGAIHGPLFRGICIAPALEEGRLGYFSPSDQSIVISEDAVTSCSGETVRNIFLHELAHAMDWNISRSISGHSVLFRQYCRMLGMDPGFEKSRIRTGISADRSRKEKIRKLLALSSSPFENEAAEAIRKAKMLMAEAGLEDAEEADNRICMVPLYEGRRFPFSIRQLLSFISSSTGVYVVVSWNGESKQAIAYGSLEETEAAIYLYDYLVSATEREIRKLRAGGEKVSKDSFLRGVISELSGKTAETSSDNALVAIRDENMRLTHEIVFPDTRISHRTLRSRGGDAASFSRGRGFGGKLDIPSGIGRKKIGAE